MIEREIFERRTILFDRLESFGFIREKDDYIIERPIYVGMRCRVRVSPLGEVSAKVYDEELDEEYVNYRNETASGAYVIGIRRALVSFLTSIAEACSLERTYIGAQANRINAFIHDVYGVSPEFMWEKFPHFGVYRNADSRKWFAIVMNIRKAKVVPGAEGDAEVMNLKLDDRAADYLGEGVYPSYHMNHKSWVSVLLDDTLSDARIAEMIEISYQSSVKKKRQ
ncbi:MAG: MmcQ/YjbR family DNA-binding protein [Clostridia bacterium]|nr:MmcQ/YjbR family DNA-binding protein [Clostridia bacterium]